MDDRFVAIDFETSNANLASICQVGVVTFEHGAVTEAWGTYVNPEDYFSGINVRIHGIDEHMVQDAPKFPDIADALADRTRDRLIVSHTSFDRIALTQALAKYRLDQISCTWLDSAKVVRRIWKQFAQRGYGLKNVCSTFGIEYRAHDAVEDARAAGEVILRAISQTGLTLPEWLARAKQQNSPIASAPNTDGPLFGEELVFTGALTISRRDAAEFAMRAGCNVTETVKNSTTLLVVGDQDITKLAGHEKSTKHRKAEMLIANGQPIRILCESDFIRLIDI